MFFFVLIQNAAISCDLPSGSAEVHATLQEDAAEVMKSVEEEVDQVCNIVSVINDLRDAILYEPQALMMKNA